MKRRTGALWLLSLAFAACSGGPICDFPKMLSDDGERCVAADGLGDGDGDFDDSGDGDGNTHGGLDAGSAPEFEADADAGVDAEAHDASREDGGVGDDAAVNDAGDASAL